MNGNANVYTIAIDNTSKAATFLPMDKDKQIMRLVNLSDKAVFVVTGEAAAPTAVFPTSATAPLKGTVLQAGEAVEVQKPTQHGYAAAIQLAAGTGNLYISLV